MKQKTEIEIELSETVAYSRRSERFETFCPECKSLVEMSTPQIAAILTRSTERKVYRLVETDEIHFIETDKILICLKSLTETLSQSPALAGDCQKLRERENTRPIIKGEKMKKMKKILFTICAVLLPLSFTASAQTDIKMKKTTRMNFPNMPAPMKNPQTGEMMDFGKLPDSTMLIKGTRMLTETRVESGDGKKIILTKLRQCDLGRELNYTNKSKKYTVTNFNSSPKTPGKSKPTDKETGGTVTFSMTFTDTGERQQLFGYTARRVKSVMTSKPSPDACQKKAMKVETDGWYIDLPTLSCPLLSPPEQPGNDGELACNDKVIYQVNGKTDRGFAVKETMTMTTDGIPPMTMTHEVTEIAKTELDAQLFEVPPGYTENKDSGTKNAQSNATLNNDKNSSLPTSTTQNNATAPIPATNANETTIQPKKPGVIRIGIVKPKMQMPDSKDDQTAPLQLSAGVRDTVIEALKTETVEAIRLNTDAPESEAKQKECDYIFYANVTQKRGGGEKCSEK